LRSDKKLIRNRDFVLSFLYFPALHRAHKRGFASKLAEHEHSIGPVPPAAPKELDVHAVQFCSILKPDFCVFSGHITHTWSAESAYTGLQTQAENCELPVTSVVKVSGHTEQL
jgi:hypothetical protein